MTPRKNSTGGICPPLFKYQVEKLIFGPAPELVYIAALIFKLLLIPIDLLVLIVRRIFPPLQLIADQRAGAQAQRCTDGCACRRMMYGRADKSARGRAA